MAAQTVRDPPPSYMSQNRQTSTLIDRPDPPYSFLLKPNHSTRASRLFHQTSRGRYSILEYYELTFSLVFSRDGVKKAIVVAVDEELDLLLPDIRKIFETTLRSLTDRVELCVKVSGPLSFEGKDDILDDGNITAMLRFLKSRNGADMILVR